MERVEKVTINIISDRIDNTEPLMNALNESVPLMEGEKNGEVTTEHTEVFSEGELIYRDGRVILRYEESELSGMEGAVTEISYAESDPGMVTMERGGAFLTSFVFENGKRHICVYNTPIMAFEICIATKEVVNRLEDEGYIFLDYVLELRGAGAERNKLRISVIPRKD